MYDYDEEQKEKRKKDVVEFRNKKRTSNMFVFFATIYEILITVLTILFLIILSSFLIFKFFDPNLRSVQLAFEIAMIVAFIGGIVLGFTIFKKTIRWFIKKFNYEDKLLDSVKIHYVKQTKEEMENELKK